MSSTNTSTGSGIKSLSLIVVPVVDQDRAIEFYESLGFEKRTDIPFGDQYRWVEVYLPGEGTGIALAPPPPGQAHSPKETGITLTSDDVDATHAKLQGDGVDVDAEVSRMGEPVPPMFWFRDPEGNSLLIVQSPPS